jgi:hypothetical protein
MAYPALTDDLLEAGSYLAASLLDWPSWCHRKVETLDLLEGRRGRRRVSLDCSPRVLNWRVPGDTFDSALVPLAYLAKDTLRDFDVRDDQGRSVPILGASSNGALAAAAIAFLLGLEPSKIDVSAQWDHICDVVFQRGADAEMAAGELIQTFVVAEAATETLIRDLARSFLLIAVLEVESRDRRQILKFSYHWESGPSPLSAGQFFRRIGAGLGFNAFSLDVDLSHFDTPESFHFECSAPNGLTCIGVHLPNDERGNEVVDSTRTMVGHAHGTYDFEQARHDGTAIVRFELDRSGLLPRVALSALAVAVIFLTLLLVPGSYASLSDEVDAATALLLFAPAILIALGTRGSENDLVSGLLRTLRWASYLLCACILVSGALLVLGATGDTVRLAWITSFGTSLGILALTFSGIVRLNVRARD